MAVLSASLFILFVVVMLVTCSITHLETFVTDRCDLIAGLANSVEDPPKFSSVSKQEGGNSIRRRDGQPNRQARFRKVVRHGKVMGGYKDDQNEYVCQALLPDAAVPGGTWDGYDKCSVGLNGVEVEAENFGYLDSAENLSWTKVPISKVSGGKINGVEQYVCKGKQGDSTRIGRTFAGSDKCIMGRDGKEIIASDFEYLSRSGSVNSPALHPDMKSIPTVQSTGNVISDQTGDEKTCVSQCRITPACRYVTRSDSQNHCWLTRDYDKHPVQVKQDKDIKTFAKIQPGIDGRTVHDIDYPGNDIVSAQVDTGQDCATFCSALPDCNMSVWDETSKDCWLKASRGRPKASAGKTTWLKSVSSGNNSLQNPNAAERVASPVTQTPAIASSVIATPTRSSSVIPSLVDRELEFGINGKVLDCDGGVCRENAKTQLWDVSGAAGQKWTYDPVRQTLTSGGFCLDVTNGLRDNGTIVRSWSCNTSPAQQWVFQSNTGPGRGSYQLRNPNSGRCLDSTGDQNGIVTRLWDCQTSGHGWNVSAAPVPNFGRPAQTTIVPADVDGPSLVNQPLQWSNGGSFTKYLDCDGAACSKNANRVQIWSGSGAPGQRWTYANRAVTSGGFCLATLNNGTVNGTPVIAWPGSGGSGGQEWVWQQKGDGWGLLNPMSGRCLDIAGGVDADGVAAQLWDCASSTTKWRPESPGTLAVPVVAPVASPVAVGSFNLENTPAAINIKISPIDGKMYAVGTNNVIYSRSRTDRAWTVLAANNCCAIAIAFDPGRKLLGAVNNKDHMVYWKANTDVTSNWVKLANSGSILDMDFDPLTRKFYAVGTDQKLYYWNNKWVIVPPSVDNLISISFDAKGYLWAVANDTCLYKQTALGRMTSDGDFTRQSTCNVIGVCADPSTSEIYVIDRPTLSVKFVA